MDIVFDIDGTLADPAHRLHFINDTAHWVCRNGKPPQPDWESFLSNEQLAKDSSVKPIWELMLDALCHGGNRVLFITGRKESSRETTLAWMRDPSCILRSSAYSAAKLRAWPSTELSIYMRADSDRRPSHVVKEEGLMRARADGYNPVLVFEDRADDTAMWRRNGLLCCQVADGQY